MKTEKLFVKDRYLKNCKSKIVDIKILEPYLTDLVLDKTIFFPTGGGQSCDLGQINNMQLTDVFESEGLVHHIVKIESEHSDFHTGDEVSCTLNWERRFLNMQRHCGEHILSGIFDREFGGVNRGFHMGSDYMTIDISLEKIEKYKELNTDMVARAEYLANAVIWENVPVTVMHFENKEDAKVCPVRKPLAIEKDITIVSVGSVENPSDCVACCGTHPNTSGAVGLIKIYKFEPYKKMYRIYFDAGKNAFLSYVKNHEILTGICKHYSAQEDNVQEKLSAFEEKHALLKDRLYKTNQALESIIFNKLLNDYLKHDETGKPFLAFMESTPLGKSEIGSLSKKLNQLDNSIFIIFDSDSFTAYISSKNALNCKSLANLANDFSGKGGGSESFASYKFSTNSSMQAFITSLKDKYSL